MAYRRSIFAQLGPFDPALDVWTVTHGGGDLDMFLRSLVEGHTLVYEPAAVVRHRHRRTYSELRRQIANNGYGFSSVLIRNAVAYPEEKMRFLYLASWWLFGWLLRRVLASIVRPTRVPVGLFALELWAGITGVMRYPRARRKARRIESSFGPLAFERPRKQVRFIRRRRGRVWVGPMAVRTVDVRRPASDIVGIDGYELTKIFVTYGDRLIGTVMLPNKHRPISARRLREAIADALSIELLAYTREGATGSAWTVVAAAMLNWYGAAEPPVLQERLSPSTRVSVVVATVDRPNGLRDCLACITN